MEEDLSCGFQAWIALVLYKGVAYQGKHQASAPKTWLVLDGLN